MHYYSHPYGVSSRLFISIRYFQVQTINVRQVASLSALENDFYKKKKKKKKVHRSYKADLHGMLVRFDLSKYR